MSVFDLELADGESLMVDDQEELIYRQVIKYLVDEHGQVATHAFTGPSSGSGKPSYARARAVSAQESRDWHTRNSRSPSLSVWALDVGEVVAAGRVVIDDSNAPLAADEVR